MPNLLLVGATNNGKTMLVRRFARLHPDAETADGGVRIPVLVVQAPPVPDESRFYAALLEAIHPIERLSGRLAAQQLQVVRRLRLVKVGLLIVGEIHHVLAGHTARQRQFLNVLKYLGNELELPIVGVGIKEALRAIQTDPQLANRFEPVALPRWEMNEDFLMLLASFERMLPLRERSKLTRPALAQELLTLSEGTIGELATLLAAAAAEAVRSERERIDEAAVSAVGWTRPSERPRRVEQLV
jgi:hypothetical protein